MDILKEKFNIYENSDSNNSLKIEIDHYYPGYINIWNTSMKDYSDISRWFSVGFYHDEVRFYLVTNNLDQDKVKEYAHTVEFSFSSSSGGWSRYPSRRRVDTTPRGTLYWNRHILQPFSVLRITNV